VLVQLAQLSSQHLAAGGRVDTDANAITLHFENADSDVVANVDGFSGLPAQYQHDGFPP
jgi:hypothetical protein